MSTELPASLASPLAGDAATADRIDRLATSGIIARYRDQFACDVSGYFAGIDELGIYRCRKTGFKFFYPYGLAGSASFYEHLEKRIPDYYDEAKWEHALAVDWVERGARVLDIGCGRGSFLAKAMARRDATVTGLESNPVAANAARERGIEIADEFIDAHALRRPAHYDVVTAFQVLEHIAEPRPFLLACTAALKPDGMLVIAVPNDDGFLGMDRQAVLNGPPHHLGLWDRRSLAALADELQLTLLRTEIEPLNHPAWFQAVLEARYVPQGWRRALWHRLGGSRYLRRIVEENAPGIAGHTIMAAYRKG